MPAIHQLRRELVIDTDLETAWNFIRQPGNLNRITPPDMDFEIVSELPEVIYDGLLIEYRVGIPLLGKQSWLSEIKHLREKHSFIDDQLVGPYKLWHHYHAISPHPKGVRFVDHLHYQLPYGVFGSLAHSLYVRDKLKSIFDFRETAMLEAFRPPAPPRVSN